MRPPLFKLDQRSGYFPFRACRVDRRFSYGTYVPESFHQVPPDQRRILIAVHGSERSPEIARELFVDLADETGCMVLAPLFPVAVTDNEEIHNYLFLAYDNIRYDHILLSMVDEVAARFNVPNDNFWLAGFSGGGQFAHRFAYLYASRLAGVSVGAPGIINTLETSRDWPIGIRDAAQIFGQPVDWEGLKKLPFHVVVGAQDLETDILIQAPSPLYAEGVNDTGNTRVERAAFLHRLLTHSSVQSQLDIVPGALHAAADVQLAVNRFFRTLNTQAKARCL